MNYSGKKIKISMHAKVKTKIAFLTSYPLHSALGSGVVRMVSGYAKALQKMGVPAQIFHPEFQPTSYLNLAVQRVAFNKRLKKFFFKDYSVLVGSDFDGFALKQPLPKIVLNAGILADIVRFEQGQTARILSHLAQRECQNVRNAQMVVVPSEYTKKKVAELYTVPQKHIRIIPLGINLKEWQHHLNTTPQKAHRLPTILCVARQYSRKGIGDLIHAFVKVRQKIPEAKLNLVGGGPELEKNQILAQNLGLKQSVYFAGDVLNLTQLTAYYRSADVFCLPSYHETFGIVFLEAMAAGLPIVTYRSAAIPEVVSGNEGVLCTAGKVDQLAENLLTLFFNANLRNEMGKYGLDKVRQFTWQASAKKFLTLAAKMGN